MARGTQHRKRRTQTHARVAPAAPKGKAKRVKHERWEDQLFFSRLRVHAKWMFVFLALVFAVGFVIFGVGSGSTGISDVLQNMFNGSSSSSSSASSLRKKAEAHPKEAKLWHDLAVKLQTDNDLGEATDALKRYLALRPRDDNVLSELANLYLRRADNEQLIYGDAQTRARVLAPSPIGQPTASSPLGKALSSVSNPVQAAVSGVVGQGSSDAYSKYFEFQNEATGVYKRIAALKPEDALTQLQLAQAAVRAGDAKTAIPAYKRFLKLAPDDLSAPEARKALKQLEAQQKATATPTTKHK